MAWSDAALAKSASSLRLRLARARHIGEFMAVLDIICCGFCFSRRGDGQRLRMVVALFPTFRSCQKTFSCCWMQSANWSARQPDVVVVCSEPAEQHGDGVEEPPAGATTGESRVDGVASLSCRWHTVGDSLESALNKPGQAS